MIASGSQERRSYIMLDKIPLDCLCFADWGIFFWHGSASTKFWYRGGTHFQREAPTGNGAFVVHDDLAQVGEPFFPSCDDHVHHFDRHAHILGIPAVGHEAIDQLFLDERLFVGAESSRMGTWDFMTSSF